MPKIIPIIEGDGEIEAVPILLRRILTERLLRYDWTVSTPKQAHSLPVLRRDLEKYIRYAESEPGSAGILIILDLDDGCPKDEALSLASAVRELYHRVPVAIVLAHKEYEAWFLAGIESLAGQHNLSLKITAPPNCEDIRDAKRWISEHMPPGKIYKETTHQAAMSACFDLEHAADRSRSFQRLISAIESILNAPEHSNAVTPNISCK
jgi:hypothetical protein